MVDHPDAARLAVQNGIPVAADHRGDLGIHPGLGPDEMADADLGMVLLADAVLLVLPVDEALPRQVRLEGEVRPGLSAAFPLNLRRPDAARLARRAGQWAADAAALRDEGLLTADLPDAELFPEAWRLLPRAAGALGLQLVVVPEALLMARPLSPLALRAPPDVPEAELAVLRPARQAPPDVLRAKASLLHEVRPPAVPSLPDAQWPVSLR